MTQNSGNTGSPATPVTVYCGDHLLGKIGVEMTCMRRLLADQQSLIAEFQHMAAGHERAQTPHGDAEHLGGLLAAVLDASDHDQSLSALEKLCADISKLGLRASDLQIAGRSATAVQDVSNRPSSSPLDRMANIDGMMGADVIGAMTNTDLFAAGQTYTGLRLSGPVCASG